MRGALIVILFLLAQPAWSDADVFAWLERCEARVEALERTSSTGDLSDLLGDMRLACLEVPILMCDFSEKPAKCLSDLTAAYRDEAAEIIASLPAEVPQRDASFFSQSANRALRSYRETISGTQCLHDGGEKSLMVQGTTPEQHLELCDAAFDLRVVRFVEDSVERALRP